MTDWSDGYVTHTEYTANFYTFLAPSAQNFALLLTGHMPVEPGSGYTYCELGCGQGYSTALLAAANPDGRFTGVDFNPAHIAGANRIKAAAAIDNVEFLERSFAELVHTGLPAFDFIALHGVWSWISPGNRQAIAAFVNAKLKPGGVVFVSYNALPGWAAVAPLRQLLIESQRGKPQLDAGAIDDAIALAKRMQALGAGYFQANAAAGANLAMLGDLSKNYLLHEYFNRDWTPFYFSEVASALRAAGLSFACSSDILEHIDALCLGKDAQALLNGVTDASARETLRDYFRNPPFRRDLFSRGARRLTAGERLQRLRDLRLTLACAKPGFPLRVNFPVGAVELPGEPCATIVEELSRKPATLGELMAHPGLARLDHQAVLQGLLLLAARGAVQAALPQAGEDRRRERTARFNRATLLQPAGLEAGVLASPVLGNGVSVPHVDQLLLALRRDDRPLSGAELLLQLHQRKLQWPQAGDAGTPPLDTPAALQTLLDDFHARRLPAYRLLGIAD